VAGEVHSLAGRSADAVFKLGQGGDHAVSF
jgi:hypothetical protein